MADSLEGGAGLSSPLRERNLLGGRETVTDGGANSDHPKLNLTVEEKKVYGQLFRAADPDGFGVVSGDVAVTFFDRTKLPSDVLGQVGAVWSHHD
jgi:hypothetical protein